MRCKFVLEIWDNDGFTRAIFNCDAFTEVLRNFKRQALHAVMLRLAHPITGEMMEWYAPLPDDFVELLHALKADYLEHKDELDY